MNNRITFLNNSCNDLLKVSILNIQSSSLFIDNNSLFDYHRLSKETGTDQYMMK